MKDTGINRGLVQKFETSKKGEEKAFYGFRKMFWTYANKLNIPFFDNCCTTANGGDGADAEVFPVRYSETTGALERYNSATEAWVAFDSTPATITTNTINEQTAAAGVTVDGVLLKDGGVTNSAGTMFAGFYGVGAISNIVAGTGGAISVAHYYTTINTDAGGDAFTLAAGTQIGQMKKIHLVADGGGDATVTGTFGGGMVTMTLDTAAEFAILLWSGTAWEVVEHNGVAFA